MKRTIPVMLVVALAAILQQSVTAATGPDDRESVGLVLSGGGSKGIAHIGVIQALEENDIPIDYITGTSMGAIVGGLYAAGYTPQEMMELILSPGFSYWSTGEIDPNLTFYFTEEEPQPVLFSMQMKSKRDSIAQARSAVPASLINPMPMSFAFMQLFSAYTAQCKGNFDNLFVPYRCVASDAAAKHKVVLSRGEFGDAIRASMSFPIVFQPTLVDSVLLYDGGIYDNFPVDVMRRDFAPSIMIGVDVSTPDNGPQTSLMDQVETLVIQSANYDLPADEGIKLHIDLHEFSLLDFPKARAIYKIGYDHAISMMDSIKARVHSRIPADARRQRRAVFKSQTPYVHFNKVEVTGGTPRQNRYIDYIFTGGVKSDTFGIEHARNSYYRAISPGKLRDLTPHAIVDENTGLFTLKLRASVKDRMKMGFGGYITSSAASYLYVSAGYSTLSFSSIASNAGIWVGQNYLGAHVNGRIYLRTRVPSAFAFQAVAFRKNYYQTDNLFYEAKTPWMLLDHEYYGRLKMEVAAGNFAKTEIGAGYGRIVDSFYGSDEVVDYNIRRDRVVYDLGQAFIRYKGSTLNDINYPTQGTLVDVAGMGVLGKYSYRPATAEQLPPEERHPAWLQLEAKMKHYFAPSQHFSLGTEADVLLSTRKLVGDYDAAMVSAPSFAPTPASANAFNASFRANSFIAIGIVPVYRYNSQLSARLSLNGFLPLRKILRADDGTAYYSHKWLANPQFFGELDICYAFPMATLSAYINCATNSPKTWNLGLTFGIYMQASRFLR